MITREQITDILGKKYANLTWAEVSKLPKNRRDKLWALLNKPFNILSARVNRIEKELRKITGNNSKT